MESIAKEVMKTIVIGGNENDSKGGNGSANKGG
jgi:hypothetical protein